MKSWLLEHAFSLVSGPIVGVAVYFLHEQLQKSWDWLDKQSPLVKRVAAFLLAALLAPLATVFGASVPQACADTTGAHLQECFAALGDKAWLGVLVGGAVALAVHKVTHSKSSPGG